MMKSAPACPCGRRAAQSSSSSWKSWPPKWSAPTATSPVRTPHVTKEDLFIRSGHLPYYEESMYPPMEMDGVRYFVKPMNCPFHHKIFGSQMRSYRDLPIRLGEYGTCYRYEKSGELFGLMRVRSMQMNDAHIYCSEEDFEQEFMDVIDIYKEYFEIFNIDKYVMRLSLHHPDGLGQEIRGQW